MSEQQQPPLLTHKYLCEVRELVNGKMIRPYKMCCHWRRLVLRQAHRSAWHWLGSLLWLLPRPYLRNLPIPYPSVVTPQDYWRQRRAPEGNTQLIGSQTLLELTQLRIRMGQTLAFLEDEEMIRALAMTRRVPGAM